MKNLTFLSTLGNAVREILELDVDGRPLGQVGELLVGLVGARAVTVWYFGRERTAVACRAKCDR